MSLHRVPAFRKKLEKKCKKRRKLFLRYATNKYLTKIFLLETLVNNIKWIPYLLGWHMKKIAIAHFAKMYWMYYHCNCKSQASKNPELVLFDVPLLRVHTLPISILSHCVYIFWYSNLSNILCYIWPIYVR